MGLRIIYGKAGSGKSEFCFSEISKLLDTQENILIITPEQFSFTAEKKLMQVAKKNAVTNAEVITLSRMAYRVMQEVGNDDVSNLSNNVEKKMLSKPAKAMLIHSIIDKNKNELKFLGKSDENVDLSMQAITEFKKHKITTNLLEDTINELEDEYLKVKLKDMKIIYESFENQIMQRYLDDTDLLTYLEQNIKKSDIAKNSIIYIDEFMGFTKQEYGILAKLIELAKQVNLTLCIDTLNPSANPISDIFYSNKVTLSKILNLQEEYHFKLDEPVCLHENHRFKNIELKKLEQNIFNTKSTVYEKNVDNIELFLAKNQYSEIENVASKITRLVKEDGLRYKEISVISKDLQKYSNLIRAIFNKYDIPVFIDEKRDLNQNVIIKYILSILEVIDKNFSFDSVMNYLKSGFTDIDEDEIFVFENYCIKWGIKYNKWKKEFTYDKQTKEQEVLRLEEIRKNLIIPLIDLRQKVQKTNQVNEIATCLYNFLEEQNFEAKLTQKIKKLQENGLQDLITEYKKSYEIIINLFDDMVNIFENETMEISKFIECFKVGLKNSSLNKIPGTQDQVIVGDVERSRSHKVKAIFIIGVNDGIFPSNNKDEGFFNDIDRENLKENGIELANGTLENLYEENFNIYKAFTTAENKLYISYASSDSTGKSLRPSMLIMKLKKIFPNIIEQSDVINKEYKVLNKKVTYEELLENIFNMQSSKKIDEIWYLVYKYYKNQNEVALNEDLKGIKYTNNPKDIESSVVEKLYGNTLKTSVSRLEKYSSCPFSYFLQYGLNLKEKEELKVQSFNTGSFMHETIDSFFGYVKEEDIKLPSLLEDEVLIENIVEKIIGEELELGKNAIFMATSKYKALVKRLKRIVTKALKYIIEGLVYSEFEVTGTEIEFGEKSEYKPIVMELDNGKKVEITGKIDRIDTAQNEDGKYLRIIDYKSSAKNIDLNQVYAGLQIQLLTYLDAVCKQEDLMPAGILYFSLLEQMVKSDKKLTEEEIENEIRKNFKMKGLILADVKIIKLHDKTLNTGTSKIVPAAITASGEINKKWTSGVNKEDFKVLQDYIYKTIKDISKEILKGKTPCDYCSYKSICGFNTKNCDNKYNYILNKSADDIIMKMKK